MFLLIQSCTPVNKQWTIDSTSAPWSSVSGRSLKCEMVSVPCSPKNVVRWANNRAVPRVQYQGACLGEVATTPLLSVTGGSVVQITLWAKMSNFIGPHGQAPQITAITCLRLEYLCYALRYVEHYIIVQPAKINRLTYSCGAQVQ